MLAAAPSWAVLAEIAKQAAAAIGAEVMTAAGRRGGSEEGAPSAQARMRTFGEVPANVRVTLYRDTHAWCPWEPRSRVVLFVLPVMRAAADRHERCWSDQVLPQSMAAARREEGALPRREDQHEMVRRRS
jgi:hypothetical protein|eukprot:COSAG02_NODE_421_length_22605_cov_158.841198_8_plen_130_part_00